jgi:ribonuclease PH
MVKPPPKLANANVYAPPLTQPPQQQQQQQQQHNRRRRQNRRRNDELRQLILQTSSSSSSSEKISLSSASNLTEGAPAESSTSSSSSLSAAPAGWAKVQLGTTVVLCHVRAPVVAASLASNQYYDGSSSSGSGNLEGNADLESGILACSVHLAPHHVAAMVNSTSGNSNPSVQQLRKIERSLERQLHQVVAPSVPLAQYAKSAVLLQLTVVSAGEHLMMGGGGSTVASQLLCPCVLAATLAMADAGVELYDLVTCGRVALRCVDTDPSSSVTQLKKAAAVEILVDPTSDEEAEAVAVLTVAHMGAWKEVTYWNQQQQQSSAAAVVRSDAMNDAAEYCLEMSKALHKFVTRHLHQMHPPPAASHGS